MPAPTSTGQHPLVVEFGRYGAERCSAFRLDGRDYVYQVRGMTIGVHAHRFS